VRAIGCVAEQVKQPALLSGSRLDCYVSVCFCLGPAQPICQEGGRFALPISFAFSIRAAYGAAAPTNVVLYSKC
jgi:hypothetical protein